MSKEEAIELVEKELNKGGWALEELKLSSDEEISEQTRLKLGEY